MLQASYFVPEGQEFFNQVAQEWGSQNGVAVTPITLPGRTCSRASRRPSSGSGADIIEMWDIWPYLYSENMVPVDDLAHGGQRGVRRLLRLGGQYRFGRRQVVQRSAW